MKQLFKPVVGQVMRPWKGQELQQSLTMRTKGVRLAADHSKGGGGVERGGDPCGRPGGCNKLWREPLPTPWDAINRVPTRAPSH
jgi:hypothetical protein